VAEVVFEGLCHGDVFLYISRFVVFTFDMGLCLIFVRDRRGGCLRFYKVDAFVDGKFGVLRWR